MGILDFLEVLFSVAESSFSSAQRSYGTQLEKAIREREKSINAAEAEGRFSSARISQEREKLESAKKLRENIKQSRRTDEDFANDTSGRNKSPKDFQIEENMALSKAVNYAASETGVYILYLDGTVMKCGRAAYIGGIRWRFSQYYKLKYDDRARNGDYWSVSESNKDRVRVAWQCCPPSVCQELEYKLFKKYGKGEWAKRGPSSCSTDNWELLI